VIQPDVIASDASIAPLSDPTIPAIDDAMYLARIKV
jgi:hypothetical protein